MQSLTATPPPASTPDPDDLRRRVRGQVLVPEDAGYEASRRLFYGGLDRRAAVVVRPRDAADVAEVVRAVRDQGVELAVRSGGHGLAGLAATEGGVLLDLSSLDELAVDPAARTAWAGVGVTAGTYTRTAGAHGLATGFGDAPSVALGGLTLGGGMGFLSRRLGLTIDSLLAAEVVTADGRVRHVDAEHDPDLFWALRGGGAGTAVATRLRFALHEVGEVTGGMLVLPASPEVLVGLVDAADAATEDLTVIANTTVAPPLPFLPTHVHGELVVIVLAVHAGPREEADAALTPVRSLASPLVDELGPLAYPSLFEDEPEPPVRPTVTMRTRYRERFDLADASAIVEALRTASAPMSVAQLRVLGGAVARVPVEATAYAHRHRRMLLSVGAMDPDPAAADEHASWVDALTEQLREPGVEEGAYLNFVGRDDHRGAEASHPGATGDRLREIRRRHDPDGLLAPGRGRATG